MGSERVTLGKFVGVNPYTDFLAEVVPRFYSGRVGTVEDDEEWSPVTVLTATPFP